MDRQRHGIELDILEAADEALPDLFVGLGDLAPEVDQIVLKVKDVVDPGHSTLAGVDVINCHPDVPDMRGVGNGWSG